MPFYDPAASQQRASAGLADALGGFLTKVHMDKRKHKAFQELRRLNTNQHPEMYAAQVYSVLDLYGLEPGPVAASQIAAQANVWRQSEQSKEAERDRKEAQKKEERAAEEGLATRLAAGRLAQEMGAPEYISSAAVRPGGPTTTDLLRMRREEESAARADVKDIREQLRFEERERRLEEQAEEQRTFNRMKLVTDRLRDEEQARRGPSRGSIPFGWTEDEEGKPSFIKGGPADPEYRKELARAAKEGQGGEYDDWTLQRMAQEYRILGKAPSISRQDTLAWARFYKEVAALATEEGDTAGAQQALRMAQYSADKSSLQTLQKRRDSMVAFVENMKLQADRLKEIYDDLGRRDVRIVNAPIRSWRKIVAGSAAEAITDMYLTEISNEIGKLSTASEASIRELSESAQEKWAGIHDPNLSLADMMRLLQETKHAGDLRMKTIEDALAEVRGRISPSGKKGELTAEKATEYLQRAGGDKEKARKLARDDGWEF